MLLTNQILFSFGQVFAAFATNCSNPISAQLDPATQNLMAKLSRSGKFPNSSDKCLSSMSPFVHQYNLMDSLVIVVACPKGSNNFSMLIGSSGLFDAINFKDCIFNKEMMLWMEEYSLSASHMRQLPSDEDVSHSNRRWIQKYPCLILRSQEFPDFQESSEYYWKEPSFVYACWHQTRPWNDVDIFVGDLGGTHIQTMKHQKSQQ